MKNLTITIISTLLAVMTLVSPVQAEMATMGEALTVADNWVALIMQKEGDWGGSETAVVETIQEFTRGERLLGYFCRVNPRGYIVISLRKELAPVKAYSTVSDLKPEPDEGMVDFIKSGMEHTLNEIEKQLGPIKSARTEDVQSMLEINHRPDWEKLQLDVQTFKAGLTSGIVAMNYSAGQVLLTSNWHQQPPYNDDCPNKDCSWPYYNNYNRNARVGCVATAAAQIMRYWAWPPGYEWWNMLDQYIWDDVSKRFEDGNGNPCSQVQINAVARLCHEVGQAADTDYDRCSESTAFLGMPGYRDMAEAYKLDRFGFHDDTDFEQRWHFGDDEWWGLIKSNLRKNRPLQYGILDVQSRMWPLPPLVFVAHSMVCDGWEEVGSLRNCHMNYGHTGTGSDTWYNINNLPDSEAEGTIRKIRPRPSLGSWLSPQAPHKDNHKSYPVPSFPYRYFDQDATGRNVSFAPGHNLQFLPRVKVTGTSPIGDYIRFQGISSNPTRLFSIKGTGTGGIVAGIKIYNGEIRLYQNGSIRFH